MVNITDLKQSLLSRLLKRAGYATLDLKPEPGLNHLAEVALIEQIRSGMIAPDDYPQPTATQTALNQNDNVEFYASSNGDRWFLCGHERTDQGFVLHRSNPASGGHEMRTSIGSFLAMAPKGPEHEALVALFKGS
ncbi:hypothetical protein ACRQ1B_16340 [Rhizobium panacihumi]|uniref:hypothetical protein n=1 Tax=Rhizobium panacihumi TaxID=2008450 RepID=UPI003D7B6F00